MLEESVKKAYTNLKELGRKKIYIAVDIHDTIAEANYKNTLPDVLKGAQKAIQALREFPEVVLILWSSCYESSYQTYLDHFKSHRMIFDYFNENPEVPNTETGDFSKKFYFNVLADDKAGFNESDWIRLVHAVAKYRVILEGGI